jgi:hypothetical protein
MIEFFAEHRSALELLVLVLLACWVVAIEVRVHNVERALGAPSLPSPLRLKSRGAVQRYFESDDAGDDEASS